MQPKTSKSKNNACGTAPGNLVLFIKHTMSVLKLQYQIEEMSKSKTTENYVG